MKKIVILLGVLLSVALFVAGCESEETTVKETAEATETEETTESVVEETAEEAVVEETTETAEEATVEETAEATETEETTESAVEETAEASAYEGASQAGCTDSDGGKNYNLAGSMVDARGVTDYDRCSENENFPGKLYESYCEEDGDHGRETYECPSNKCSAGACVEAEEITE